MIRVCAYRTTEIVSISTSDERQAKKYAHLEMSDAILLGPRRSDERGRKVAAESLRQGQGQPPIQRI